MFCLVSISVITCVTGPYRGEEGIRTPRTRVRIIENTVWVLAVKPRSSGGVTSTLHH